MHEVHYICGAIRRPFDLEPNIICYVIENSCFILVFLFSFCFGYVWIVLHLLKRGRAVSRPVFASYSCHTEFECVSIYRMFTLTLCWYCSVLRHTVFSQIHLDIVFFKFYICAASFSNSRRRRDLLSGFIVFLRKWAHRCYNSNEI